MQPLCLRYDRPRDDSKCSSSVDDCCACDASIGMTECSWVEPATCRDGYIALPTPGSDGGRHNYPSCEYSCYPPGTTSEDTCSKPGAYLSGADCGPHLVYVAEPQDYYGAQAECAARGGALARFGSIDEAYRAGWSGDPHEIWIADSGGESGSGASGSTTSTTAVDHDTCYTGICPCIDCGRTSEIKPFICRMTAARAASW